MDEDYWESRFAQQFQEIEDKQKPGAILPLIPGRDEWLEFTEFVRAQWRIRDGYYSIRRDRPHCFVVLFGGVAFYEYEEHRFWPYFAEQVGTKSIPANKQHEINEDFARVAAQLSLKILGTGYVGSAVYHIGVPLSLWEHFLKFCEWALWHEEWETLDAGEWKELINKRFQNRPRLRTFLIDNRATASVFIHEMLDARQMLSDSETLTINDLKQVSILRQEYFDEVPETAEFLRPTNPDSLFPDRAKLYWDKQHISLHLPVVANDKLPAVWKIDNIEPPQPASSVPDTLHLDSAAFVESLSLRLQSREQGETQRLKGIAPFGLWDDYRNKFVNPKRETQLIGEYILISPNAVNDLTRNGFDEEENPVNERIELADQSICYSTRLWPTGRKAEISFGLEGKKFNLRFRPSDLPSVQFFSGTAQRCASFTRHNGFIETDELPVFHLSFPYGFTDDLETYLSKLEVVIDSPDSFKTFGKWIKDPDLKTDDHEFYYWLWNKCPVEPSTLTGSHTLYICDSFGRFRSNKYDFKMIAETLKINDCFDHLPGSFLPLCLIGQAPDGLCWADINLNKDFILSGQPVSYSLLRQYEEYGILSHHNKRWRIAESRAVPSGNRGSLWTLQYCGEPSLLWGLYRELWQTSPRLNLQRVWSGGRYIQIPLPLIEVVDERGQLPFLQMNWTEKLKDKVVDYLFNHHVRIVSDLWRP